MTAVDGQMMNAEGRPVTVVIGATSKWQADGPNTRLLHGDVVDGSMVPETSRWGLGGAIAQRFAAAGHLVVLTTRTADNAASLVEAITSRGGHCMVVELDVASADSVSDAFDAVRGQAGDPDAVVYNAGYMAGRALPADQELLEHFPLELFEEAIATACRGPFLVAKQVLPAMRRRGSGSLLFTNNQYSLRGRKRHTGESLYYPRTMMRALAQALTEEYSSHGVHVANVVVDGPIDSPGMRATAEVRDHPERLLDPAALAEAYFYLHSQHASAWTHELQLSSPTRLPSY